MRHGGHGEQGIKAFSRERSLSNDGRCCSFNDSHEHPPCQIRPSALPGMEAPGSISVIWRLPESLQRQGSLTSHTQHPPCNSDRTISMEARNALSSLVRIAVVIYASQ